MKMRPLYLGATRTMPRVAMTPDGAAMEVRNPGMAAIELTETVLACAQRGAAGSRMNALVRSSDCHVRPGNALIEK
jgi:hypothetical protein